MINYSKKSELKKVLAKEKQVVNYYDEFENNIKNSLETYIAEFQNVTLENEVLKTMLINNFASAVIQVDNNIQNVQSLSNILEILEKQDEVTPTDIDTYNKLFSKVDKDIELLQNFLAQTISGFDNIPITGKKKTVNTLNECKDQLLYKIDLSKIEKEEEKPVAKSTSKKVSNAIKKKMDLSSSDLLCFFPKSNTDSLVISTVQPNYKISFENDIANIYIEDEDFNLSLKTFGVQVSNSNTNNILFVSHSEHKYTIITNSQIELPRFIQVSKISKNDDFLEVEISNPNLSLNIKDNVIDFEDKSAGDKSIENKFLENKSIENKVVENKVVENKIVENNNVDDVFGSLNNLHSLENDIEPKPVETPKPTESHIYEPIPVKEVAEPVVDSNIKIQADENEVKDNNTLIISDSNQNVVLPYKVIELEEKLRSNKKYKTLQDVIKNEYTLPLETFKNPTKSRFREAFQLIKKKEHGSLKEAIELGFELMFQSDLNPAVIAACKDLDELDIYLDCLDDNELDKFSCFKIEYNVPPTKKGKGRH